MTAERESDQLHARVRRFAERALCADVDVEADFEELGLAIARHQLAHGSVLRSLASHHGARFDRLSDVPAVPADAFRRGRVATHAVERDVICFHTSGTTGGSGAHPLRTVETYRELSVLWGRRALLGGRPAESRVTALALAPPFQPARRSSLGFMLEEFMRRFDGRALAPHALSSEPGEAGGFDALDPARWLLASGRVDLRALRRGVAIAEQRREPLLLMTTSFALVWLLEALGRERLPLPPGSIVMQTGGFKGHARTLDEAELAQRSFEALGLEPQRLIGEYGMTELSSQLYDTGYRTGRAGQSVFVPPPWLRVTPVDPVSLEPVPAGEVGIARFTDLANVDSAVCVLTRDNVRAVDAGIVLLGRRPGARLRGCSLAIEELAARAPSGAAP